MCHETTIGIQTLKLKNRFSFNGLVFVKTFINRFVTFFEGSFPYTLCDLSCSKNFSFWSFAFRCIVWSTREKGIKAHCTCQTEKLCMYDLIVEVLRLRILIVVLKGIYTRVYNSSSNFELEQIVCVSVLLVL